MSTYQIAVGNPEGWARLAALDGEISYVGHGVYKDENGNVIDPKDVLTRYEQKLRERVGIRWLKVEPKIEGKPDRERKIQTPWSGQVPEGLKDVKAVMGLNKEAAAKTSFGHSYQSMIKPAADDILHMIYAGARMFVNNGYTLGEGFEDSRNLGIRTGRGLPGVVHFIKLVMAALEGREQAGGMLLPNALQSAAMGVWLAMISPKESSVYLPIIGRVHEIIHKVENNEPVSDEEREFLRSNLNEMGSRTLGRNGQGSYECATVLGLMADAADNIGTEKPGQRKRLGFQVGSGEAPHGLDIARICAVGFNSVIAMETLKQLKARGADQDLWHGYAPFTDHSFGFWAGEGGFMVNEYDLLHAIKKGFLFDAILGGYGVYPDEGDKENHAGLGTGIYNAILEAMNMAIDGHGIGPNDIDWINFHGTGTPETNKKEPLALVEVLKALGFRKGIKRIKISALKALLAHGLGVAGGLELAVILLSIRYQKGPGLFNLKEGRKLIVPEDIQAWLDFSPDLKEGDINVVGAASEGFSGNNVFKFFIRPTEEQLLRYEGVTRDDIRIMRELQAEREAVADDLDERIRTGRLTMTEMIEWGAFKDKQKIPSPSLAVGWRASLEKETGALSPEADEIRQRLDRLAFNTSRWIIPAMIEIRKGLASSREKFSDEISLLDDLIQRLKAEDPSAFFALTGLPALIKNLTTNAEVLEMLGRTPSAKAAINDFIAPTPIEKVSPPKIPTDTEIPLTDRRVAISFPGQGAFDSKRQTPARNLYDTELAYRDVVDQAHQRLAKYGYDLKQMLFSGSDDELIQTKNQQPVLVTDELGRRSIARKRLDDAGISVVASYGDSLGLISAAYEAGYFESEADAVEFAFIRGDVMGTMNPFGPEARPMGIALGYDEAGIRRVVEEVKEVEGVHVTISKRNGVGKLVMSGEPEGIKAVSRRLAAKKASLAEIPVSTPFHDEHYFKDAAAELLDRARQAGLLSRRRDGSVRLIANSTGQVLPDDIDILEFLAKEIAAPVDLVTSMQSAATVGANVFIEVGPKSTMTNDVGAALAAADNPPNKILAVFVSKPEDLDKVAPRKSEEDMTKGE